MLTKKQEAIVRRVQRAMDDAKREGLVTFCDAESWGIRFVPEEEIERDADARGKGVTVECSAEYVSAPAGAGETVYCESACGTPSNRCTVM